MGWACNFIIIFFLKNPQKAEAEKNIRPDAQ